MRSASIWTIACAAALTFACSDNANRDNNTAAGTDRTSAPADRAPGSATPTGTTAADQSTTRDPGPASTAARANNAADDNAFVEKMAQANIAEVKLGQLAAERASNAQVKQFGRRMASDHQKANNELKQVASKMAVQLPAETDAKHQQLYDRLSTLKGAEFDREYMKAMVDGHKKAESAFSKQADQQKTEIDRWAASTLPTIRMHLEHAKQLESQQVSANQ